MVDPNTSNKARYTTNHNTFANVSDNNKMHNYCGVVIVD